MPGPILPSEGFNFVGGRKTGGVTIKSGSDIEELIARVVLRDRQAFLDIYDATSAKLFGVCLRILKDRTMAEDALQDIYVKIWRNASSYRPGKYSPMTWLIAIARNHSIDIIRASPPVTEELEEAYDLSSVDPDPEANAVLSGEIRRVDECMDELEGQKADAVRAAYMEGFSYQELADRHSVPINTMRTWLRRSLISLRECLER